MLNGLPLPPIIIGTWQLAGGHGPVDPAGARTLLRTFVDAGMTAFDCADIYTGVEELLGEFLLILEPSLRSRVRVHTKYVPDLAALGLLSAPDVDRAIARSRARIGVDALDLVQFHWWDTSVQRYTGTALRLMELRAAGWIADLGLTNFGTSALQRLVDAGVTPATHQLQYSLLDRRAAGDMTRLCEELGIGLLCYGVLAGGFLSERWIGASEPGVPLENRSLTKYKLIIDEFGGWALFQRLLSLLSRIARGHQVGIGTVAIRWALDQRQVRAVIVGARSSEHLQTIARASTLRLDESDHAAIAEVLADARGPSGDVYELERDRDGPHGRIMRYDLGGSD